MKMKKRFVGLSTMLVIAIASTILMLTAPLLSSQYCFLAGKSFSSSRLSESFPDRPDIPLSSEARTEGEEDEQFPSSSAAEEEEEQDERIIRRVFKPYGSAAHVFILMSAYRGGAGTFAVIGSASKTLHVFGEPRVECEWVPDNASAERSTVRVDGFKMLPDWGYGRVYLTLIVNCTFPDPVGVDGLGGELVLYAHHSVGGRVINDDLPPPERIVVLREEAGSLNLSKYASAPELDYVYCGSPLFGDLSPQRVREWMAYHVKLLGKKSHFVMYDAGGVHPGVLRVFEPWMEAGYVTVEDIRGQEWFAGYYHNQVMMVNDCLHRYRFSSKWIFYFDIDEYLLVVPAGGQKRRTTTTLESVMNSLVNYTQFTIQQITMSHKHCHQNDSHRVARRWGFQKLVFKDVKTGIWRDRKYAIQARNALATGVHFSENVIGYTTHRTEDRLAYYHYHGAISSRPEPCREFVNATNFTYDDTPFVYDGTMRKLAPAIRRFESEAIGDRLGRTEQ